MDIGLDVHGDRTLDFDFEIAGTSQTSRTPPIAITRFKYAAFLPE